MSRHPIPLFIVGSGRSGTTVTAALLNRFPRVHIAKETGYIGLEIEQLRHVDDPAVVQRLLAVVNQWLSKEQWDVQATEQGFREFCNRYQLAGGRAFINYIWQLDSPVPWHELEYIGDNTPLYVMAIPAILEFMPESRFIHMMRDPRDLVCSILKMRFGADDLVTAALEWHIYVGCWLMAERLLAAEHRIECRYEDLCTNTEQALGKLADFLGRDRSEAAAALAAHATGLSTDPRFQKVATLQHHTRLSEPLNAGRIARYRKELSAEQIRIIEEIAQYGMKAYGYQPTQWHTHPLMREDRMYLLKAMIRDMARRFYKRMLRRSA
ncbi:MAG: sulfotransferase [Planctomycetota bacterium]